MDTAEAAARASDTSVEAVYDGFISYSHAADDLLAPRLQSGLQRFAKPWWKRRALRIFRDEASLSANPHLWSSITEALDQSGWFVLLLSPDAAESEWVNQEIAYWLEHKDSDRIIPVLSEGEFGWVADDVAGDAVPVSLQGAFAAEPRWVDLRFARSEEQLDLKNPRFSAAVADVASAIRGVPKDELESEEVKQHRKTIRIVWAAALAVVGLAAAAVVFGLQADRQATLATSAAEAEAAARIEAESQRTRAEENAALAQQNEALAVEREQQAVEQAALVEARRLIAAADNALSEDPELSLLLALQALRTAPAGGATVSSDVSGSLQAGLEANRLVRRFAVPEGRNLAVISPDGRTIYHAWLEGGEVRAIDTATERVLWTHEVEPDSRMQDLEISPDGRQLSLRLELGGTVPSRLTVLGTSDGSVITNIEPGTCAHVSPRSASFSPDGRLFSLYTGTAACGRDPDADWAAIYDTTTWEQVAQIKATPTQPDPSELLRPGTSDGVVFSADSTRVLVFGFRSEAEILSFPRLGFIGTHLQINGVALSPSGGELLGMIGSGHIEDPSVLSEPVLITLDSEDAEDPERIRSLRIDRGSPLSHDESMSFSPNGSRIAVTTPEHDFVFIWRDNWMRLTRLPNNGFTSQHSWTRDSLRLLTVTETGSILLWNTSDQPFSLGSLPSLSLDGVLEAASESLTRGFTSVECSLYSIVPCPSLQDLQSR